MHRVSPKIRHFAEAIVSQENAVKRSETARSFPALRACEKLRGPLAPLMGEVGFLALLNRALVLAITESPALAAWHVDSDGTLQGTENLDSKNTPHGRSMGGVTLLAYLLDLMTTLIGETLTKRVAQEVWPKLAFDTPVRGLKK